MLKADLSGRTALVTGASSGLGAHFASVLASAGADVIVAARRISALEGLVDAIRSAGGSARAAVLDVCDRDSIEDVISANSRLDILVNNAGVTVSKPALEQDEADWDYVVATNLKGAYQMAVRAARTMRDHGGSIINIASILGIRQAGGVASYAISKAGILQMTKSLALELARYAVRVNAIAPGYFETELNEAFFESEAGVALIRRIPMRRLGVAPDLDGPLLLLASDASRFMTGSVLVVDGGHLVSSL
jgi:NAD(P)-dependent dehydrogenase (short-subunit alcohol dehydrogenase family)